MVVDDRIDVWEDPAVGQILRVLPFSPYKDAAATAAGTDGPESTQVRVLAGVPSHAEGGKGGEVGEPVALLR